VKGGVADVGFPRGIARWVVRFGTSSLRIDVLAPIVTDTGQSEWRAGPLHEDLRRTVFRWEDAGRDVIRHWQ